MENLPVPTRAQSNFLRTLKQDPNLPAKQWPGTKGRLATLRKR